MTLVTFEIKSRSPKFNNPLGSLNNLSCASFAFIKLLVQKIVCGQWPGGQTEMYGLFCTFVAPTGRKPCLLFSVRNMSGGLRNPCLTIVFCVNFL